MTQKHVLPVPQLLSRDEFKKRVFQRSNHRCVFCGRDAEDAHHILERKLFDDGGYYLDNGAAVCEVHHWQCETTELSVEAVRTACGISAVVLPPAWPAAIRVDKWGNRVRADGLREAGPLFEDTGCQKALRQGGFIGLFVPAGTPDTGESR